MSEPVPSIAPVQENAPGLVGQPYKPPCNPCPCTTLQCGAKVVAILTIIWGIVGAIIDIAFLLTGRRIGDYVYLSNGVRLNFYVLIVKIILYTVLITVGTFLFLGATQLNRMKCCVWFIGASIIEIIWILVVTIVLGLAALHGLLSYVIIGESLNLIDIAILAYFLYIVYCFTQEIKFNPTGPVFLVSS